MSLVLRLTEGGEASHSNSTTVHNCGLELLFEVLLLLLAKVLITLSPLHLMVIPHPLAAIHLFIATWTTCHPGLHSLSLHPSRGIAPCAYLVGAISSNGFTVNGFASLMIV